MWNGVELECLLASASDSWSFLCYKYMREELADLSFVWKVWQACTLGHYASSLCVEWVGPVCVFLLALWWWVLRGSSWCTSIWSHVELVFYCHWLFSWFGFGYVLVGSVDVVWKLFICRKLCILDLYCWLGRMTKELPLSACVIIALFSCSLAWSVFIVLDSGWVLNLGFGLQFCCKVFMRSVRLGRAHKHFTLIWFTKRRVQTKENIIHSILYDNSFPINPQKPAYWKPKQHLTIQTPTRTLATFTYTGKETTFITNIFTCTKLQIASRTNITIQNPLMHKSQKSDKYASSGVYKLTCPDCKKAYEVCFKRIQPYLISREPVAWPWWNLAASQRRPFCASVNSHSPVRLVSR
jgi:hypothetical protein